MSDDPSSFPLAWPIAVPRHKGRRTRAQFNRKERQSSATLNGYTYTKTKELTVADGLTRVQAELSRFGATRLVVSSNIPVRRDGLPYSNQKEPTDPGVAVYFRLRGKPYCLPCDRWDRVADNLAAIAAHIAALRGIERWGVGTLEQAFTGYLALPDPNMVDWRAEFPHVTTLDGLEQTYRARAKELHPDGEGSHDAMVRLNRARDAARAELSRSAAG